MATLHHVWFPTDKFDETAAFYKTVVGVAGGDVELNLLPATQGGDKRSHIISDGRVEYHYGAPHYEWLFQSGRRLNPTRYHHAFRVDDFAAAKARLDDAGVPYEDFGESMIRGRQQLYSVDPGGNVFELTEISDYEETTNAGSKLHHVWWPTYNWQETADFYEDVVGISGGEVIFEMLPTSHVGSNAPKQSKIITDGFVELHFGMPDHRFQFTSGKALSPYWPHHCFQVDDIDVAKERLNEMGVPFMDFGDHTIRGRKFLYMYDTNGHIAELMELY